MAQQKLSPAGFGKLVGANRSQIYRLLTDERGPSAGLAARIEDETGIRTAEWPVRRRGSVKTRSAPRRANARLVRRSPRDSAGKPSNNSR